MEALAAEGGVKVVAVKFVWNELVQQAQHRSLLRHLVEALEADDGVKVGAIALEWQSPHPSLRASLDLGLLTAPTGSQLEFWGASCLPCSVRTAHGVPLRPVASSAGADGLSAAGGPLLYTSKVWLTCSLNTYIGTSPQARMISSQLEGRWPLLHARIRLSSICATTSHTTDFAPRLCRRRRHPHSWRAGGGCRSGARHPASIYGTVAIFRLDIQPLQAPTASPQLEGRWRLLYTSKPGTASPIQRTFTGIDAFSIFQVYKPAYARHGSVAAAQASVILGGGCCPTQHTQIEKYVCT